MILMCSCVYAEEKSIPVDDLNICTVYAQGETRRIDRTLPLSPIRSFASHIKFNQELSDCLKYKGKTMFQNVGQIIALRPEDMDNIALRKVFNICQVQANSEIASLKVQMLEGHMKPEMLNDNDWQETFVNHLEKCIFEKAETYK